MYASNGFILVELFKRGTSLSLPKVLPPDPKKYKVVALGGTFDHFHKGHRALIDEGFRRGEMVMIGVVSDKLAKELGKSPDADYKERKSILISYIKKKYPKRKWKVFQLDDPYGPFGTDPSVEAIIVTPESLPRAERGNLLRTRKGLKPVDILMVPLVLAEDGIRISSTRIRKKEIDEEGHLLQKKCME